MPNFKEFIKGFEEKPEQPEKDELFDKYKALGHDNTTAKLLANDERERNNPENKRLEKVAQQRVERGIDAKPLDPQHIKSTGYLGFGSPEKLEEASKPQPKISNYRQWRSNPENAKREKEADAKYKPMYEELDKKDDELYKAYYYEQDPEKKAELKAQLDENDKKFDALFEEWGEATGYPETPEEKRAWLALRNMSQPKEGSFEKAFGDKDETYEANQRENAKEEGDLVYNEGETNDDYLKGLKIGDEVTIDGKVAQIVPPARVSSTRDKAGKVFFQYRVYPYRTGYIEKDAGEAIKPVTDEERAQAKALDDQARKFGYSSFSDY